MSKGEGRRISVMMMPGPSLIPVRRACSVRMRFKVAELAQWEARPQSAQMRLGACNFTLGLRPYWTDAELCTNVKNL